jgi:hypothetical protein
MASEFKSLGWRLLYSRWRPEPIEKPGYSVLLMFPGDLPVFLNLAMEVVAAQDPKHMTDLLVIPDKMQGKYEQQWPAVRARWPHGSVRLVKLRPMEQRLARHKNNPHIYCWLQLIRGMEAARSSHALWHDADLFLINREVHRELYETAAARNMACFGMDPAAPYANPWFEARGIHHLVASYEMMMDVRWFRGFSPWEHRGQEIEINGESHVGDICYRPMIKTPAERCGWKKRDEDFVHFSYVIGTYRWFQNSKSGFEDERFKLLLVRLLVDAFDPQGWYEVPAAGELAKGLEDKNVRVTYLKPETRTNYAEFRGTLERLLSSGLLEKKKEELIRERVSPFDKALAWRLPAAA